MPPAPITTITIMDATMTIDSGALQKLLAWNSPGYPIGAFSYSHGLERAVEDGAVTNAASLIEYVSASLERGCAWIDAVYLVAAYRADEAVLLDELADECAAFRASGELALESRQQGAAFLTTTRNAWPHPALDAFATSRVGKPIAHAIAAALAARVHGVPLPQALEAFLHGFAANAVSAGVRLIPLGQTDGQIALSALASSVTRVAALAQRADRHEIGTSALGLDIFSMRHETQYTRLFRS